MLRHPRPSERDAARLHDPSPVQAHPHILQHPQQPPHHPPHLNGNGPSIPPTPNALSNGTANHPSSAVSPTGPASALPNGVGAASSITAKLAAANEQTWLLIGRVAEQMGDLEHALSAYENALRHNPASLSGLTQVAGIARIKENYPKACFYSARISAAQIIPPINIRG
ncbi:hypothetical protein HGRIS_014723 [Hohenbuehelia grisea]|uniref:Tetratricopeptide repeat protein n=1 Tax=Hohenbuehelia grisea TaxID=104357 RepID=A0ABR3IQJ3_9AGAR